MKPKIFPRAMSAILLGVLLSVGGLGSARAYGQQSGGNSPSQSGGADAGRNRQEPRPGPSKTGASTAQRPNELQKALEEFRIQTGVSGPGDTVRKSVFGAKSAGRQNTLTGRIYENFRNDFLDATPHQVTQRGGSKSLLRRNQYGFSLGGPVLLPKVYDGRGRTFFSAAFEGTRERISQSSLFSIPTEQRRNGDFSDLVDSAGKPVLIYDPLTTRPNPDYDASKPASQENLQILRDPFPNNTIPENRIDPVARAITALYPKPNAAVGPYFQNNYSVNSPFENRADGVIAKIDHGLSAKQQLGVNFTYSSGTRKSPAYFPGPANSGSPSYGYRNGSLTIQDAYTVSPQMVWTFRGSASFGSTISIDEGGDEDYPASLGLKGIYSKFFPRLQFSDGYLAIGPQASGFSDRSRNYSGSASVSINRQEHTWRMSGLAQRRGVNSFGPTYPAGYFYFNGLMTGQPGVTNTGNSFAQFLLGEVTRGEESIVLHPSYYTSNFIDLNVGDEYRVRPGLTANFSLSLEIATPRIEKYDRQSTVSLDHINPANGEPGALIFAGRDGVGRALRPATARLEPSFGLAFNPMNDRKTMIRLNYSLNYEEVPLYGRHFGTQGFNASPVFVSPNEQLEAAFQLREGLPNNFQTPPYLDPTAANGLEPDYIDPSGVLPADQYWSVSLQRELPHSLAFEARYAGTKSTHQFVDGAVRLNAAPLDGLVYGEQLYDDQFRNSLRPLPQYRTFDVGGLYPGGDLEGHSLTLTLDQRLAGGLIGRASYRFSKQMDNYSSGVPQDPYDRREEWSLSTYDVTHSLQVNYTYEFPFGKGRKLFNDGGVMDHIMGGWSLSGITTLSGGTPLQLRALINRTGGLIGNLRVNPVPGVDPQIETQTAEQWFNAEAFTQPDDFTLGAGPRTHPTLRTPGDQYHHLSLTKRVILGADASLEFVTESFNFPNHANLNDPDTRIGSAANPNLNAGKIIGSTGGRVMQLGMRILF
jgi:hypothetical protein